MVAAQESATADWLGLDGARVLIAGAGGIGAAAAAGYAAHGAFVVVADRDSDRLESVAARAPELGSITTVEVDLTEPGACGRLVDDVIASQGSVDVLLHCVGINDRRPLLEFTEQEWAQVLQVNLGTAFALAQAAGRHMTAKGHGRIVMLSSVSGLLAHEHHAPYAASKGGMNQLVRVMAREWAAQGVTVNAVAPGYIETNLTASYLDKPGVREGLTALVPAGRLGVPEEVVGPILFLSSAHAGFVTGHVMYIDGGRTLV